MFSFCTSVIGKNQIILDEEYTLHTLVNHTRLGEIVAKALGLSQISIKTSLRQKVFFIVHCIKRYA